jgi:hypothetical protein
MQGCQIIGVGKGGGVPRLRLGLGGLGAET